MCNALLEPVTVSVNVLLSCGFAVYFKFSKFLAALRLNELKEFSFTFVSFRGLRGKGCC